MRYKKYIIFAIMIIVAGILAFSFINIFFGIVKQFDKDEYEGYEHYNLNNLEREPNYYTLYSEERNNLELYAYGDISKEKNYLMMSLYGLFYNVAKDDYILLDTMDPGIQTGVFKDDKLYVTGGELNKIYEYTLNGVKTSKKELKFNYIKNFVPRGIKVDDENIYLYAETSGETTAIGYIDLKCSLVNYNCEKYED